MARVALRDLAKQTGYTMAETCTHLELLVRQGFLAAHHDGASVKAERKPKSHRLCRTTPTAAPALKVLPGQLSCANRAPWQPHDACRPRQTPQR